jgi:hypothetical protein
MPGNQCTAIDKRNVGGEYRISKHALMLNLRDRSRRQHLVRCLPVGLAWQRLVGHCSFAVASSRAVVFRQKSGRG